MTSSTRSKSERRRKLHRQTQAYWPATTLRSISLACAEYDEWCSNERRVAFGKRNKGGGLDVAEGKGCADGCDRLKPTGFGVQAS